MNNFNTYCSNGKRKTENEKRKTAYCQELPGLKRVKLLLKIVYLDAKGLVEGILRAGLF